MPRKLGQHFLTNDSILEQLAVAACGSETARVIEIGPGRGALTRHLLPRCAELHAIEIDRQFAEYLSHKFLQEPKLHIHQADVLSVDLSQWGAAVIAGNLPYYITSPIVEKFLELDTRFTTAVFLMQREVAQRLLAKPHSRDYGYLTVATRIVCDVELVCEVPASAFSPPPKVESSALLFRKKRELTPEIRDLLRFVGRCFAQKRKTLRNNLKPFYGDAIAAMPEAGLRAEQLELAQFAELWAKLKKSEQ